MLKHIQLASYINCTLVFTYSRCCCVSLQLLAYGGYYCDTLQLLTYVHTMDVSATLLQFLTYIQWLSLHCYAALSIHTVDALSIHTVDAAVLL